MVYGKEVMQAGASKVSRRLGPRIAVVGAGALGTMLGTRLTDAGLDVELVDADRKHVEALNERGAAVTGTVSWQVLVQALTPETMRGEYDLVFLLVKLTHNQTALPQLAPHLHKQSLICTLQNGIPEPTVAAAFGTDRTMGGAVTWSGTYLGPGRVESTSAPTNWRIVAGTLDGKVTHGVEEARRILSLMCPTELVTDLLGVRWAKLLLNVTLSGMSAALGCSFGEVLDDAKALACMQYIARECILVAEAEGVRMAEVWPGVDFAKAMYFENEGERPATADIHQRLGAPVREAKASMLQDLEKGRTTEIEFLNGAVSEAGRRHGIPTPVNDTVVQVVKGIERGELELDVQNLGLFELP